jgi:hypothetical protein
MNMNLPRREFLRLGGATLALSALDATAAPDAGAFEFIAVNDTHFLDEACRVWHQRAATLMRDSSPQAVFCLHAGDVSDRGDAAACNTMSKLYSLPERPFYCVPGNHDSIRNGDRSGYDAVFPGRLNYALTHEGWQFLGLDTTQGVDFDETQIPPATLAWVEAQASVLDLKKPTFVFTHFPLGEGTEMRPRNADDLITRLAKFNVKWVHSGHWHAESLHKAGEMPLSTSRCCARIRSNRDGSPLKGWHVYRAAADGGLSRRFVALPA